MTDRPLTSRVRALLAGDRLLTPGEVGEMFAVNPGTVSRWAAEGRVPSERTPGGRYRFRESVIRAFLEDGAA